MSIPFELSRTYLLLAVLSGGVGISQAAGLHIGWCSGAGNKHVNVACTGLPQGGTDPHSVPDVNHPPTTFSGPSSVPTPQVVLVPTDPGSVLLELQSPQTPQQATSNTQITLQPLLRPRPLVPPQTPSVVEGPGKQIIGGPSVLVTVPGRPEISSNAARPPVIAPPGLSTSVLQAQPLVPPLRQPPVRPPVVQPPAREPSPQVVLQPPPLQAPTLTPQVVAPPLREPGPQVVLQPPPLQAPTLTPQVVAPPLREPSPQVVMQPPPLQAPTLTPQVVAPPLREPSPQVVLQPPPLQAPTLTPQVVAPPLREPSPQVVLQPPPLQAPSLPPQVVAPPLREPSPQVVMQPPPLQAPSLPPQVVAPALREPSPQVVMQPPPLQAPTLTPQMVAPPLLEPSPQVVLQPPPLQAPTLTPQVVAPPLREPGPQVVLQPPPLQAPSLPPQVVAPPLREPSPQVVLQPPPLKEPLLVTLDPGKPEVTVNPALPPQLRPPESNTTLQALNPPPDRVPSAVQLLQTSPLQGVFRPPLQAVLPDGPGSSVKPTHSGQTQVSELPKEPLGGPGQRPNALWVVAMPGRQLPHDLPTRTQPGVAEAVVQCLVSGFGWRRLVHSDGNGALIGVHPQLRTTDILVRDIPANRHTHAGCVVEVQRRWTLGGLNSSRVRDPQSN